MSIHHRVRSGIVVVSLAALTGCGSFEAAMKPLSSEQRDAVREECGSMPPKSRVKNAVNSRRRAYLDCKRNVVKDEADHEPRT